MKGSDMACKDDFGGPGRTQCRKLRTKALCLLTTALMGDPFTRRHGVEPSSFSRAPACRRCIAPDTSRCRRSSATARPACKSWPCSSRPGTPRWSGATNGRRPSVSSGRPSRWPAAARSPKSPVRQCCTSSWSSRCARHVG